MWIFRCRKDVYKRQDLERSVLKQLDAGCHEPIGIYSVLQNGQLEVWGISSPREEVKRIHLTGGTSRRDIEKLASEAWKDVYKRQILIPPAARGSVYRWSICHWGWWLSLIHIFTVSTALLSAQWFILYRDTGFGAAVGWPGWDFTISRDPQPSICAAGLRP